MERGDNYLATEFHGLKKKKKRNLNYYLLNFLNFLNFFLLVCVNQW